MAAIEKAYHSLLLDFLYTLRNLLLFKFLFKCIRNFEWKSCQIIRKCRIESNTKIYEIARNFAKIGPFSYKISTFAKFQKSLS